MSLDNFSWYFTSNTDTDKIKKEWDNILRIMASLALKETTQSIIVKKLASHLRKNHTQQALWEFDNIIKSIYILRWIDDVVLRQHVQKALNRGESYHQLRRAIPFANAGKSRVKTEVELQVWGECARLIANCIIFYNAYILSELMTLKQEKGMVEDFHAITKLSPVGWRHVNLFGRYTFRLNNASIDVDKMVQGLADVPVLVQQENEEGEKRPFI